MDATIPYGRSIFQTQYFKNLITDSDSSQKSMYTNYFYFFKILTRTLPKTEKTMKNQGKFQKVMKKGVFLNFEDVPIGILKK